MFLSNLLTVLTEVEATGGANEFSMRGIACIAAAIAVLGGMACAIMEGLTAIKAVEGVARNPEAAGKLRSTMMMGCAMAETTGIYSLLVAMLILFLVAM